MQAHEENAELRGSSGRGYGCLKLPRASFPAKTSGKWHRRQNERSPIRRYKPSRRLRLSVARSVDRNRDAVHATGRAPQFPADRNKKSTGREGRPERR